jgi:SAM-dependent methyltransferase
MIEFGKSMASQQTQLPTHWKQNSKKYRVSAVNRRHATPVRRLVKRLLGTEVGQNGSFEPATAEFHHERHHHVYGAPWCIGRDQFDYLKSRGISSTHNVLDFGCGSLRLGVWMIPYLNSGCYFGIDSHYPSLKLGVEYEIPLHALESQNSRLLLSDEFEIDHFGVKFDRVVAMSVLHHLTDEQQRMAIEKIIACSTDDLVLHAVGFNMTDSALSKYGLRRSYQETCKCKMAGVHLDWQEIKKSG